MPLSNPWPVSLRIMNINAPHKVFRKHHHRAISQAAIPSMLRTTSARERLLNCPSQPTDAHLRAGGGGGLLLHSMKSKIAMCSIGAVSSLSNTFRNGEAAHTNVQI